MVGSLGTSALNVALGGTLTGTGTAGNVRAAVNISDGGRLALTSGSSLSVGALTLAPGAFVDVALGAPSTTRLLEVNGNLTLDGTLNITDIGGFGTGVYRLIDYTGALTNNGMLIGLFPGSVDISQLALQTAIGQQLNLVVTAPGSIVQFWDGVQTTANGTIDGGNGTWGRPPTGPARTAAPTAPGKAISRCFPVLRARWACRAHRTSVACSS